MSNSVKYVYVSKPFCCNTTKFKWISHFAFAPGPGNSGEIATCSVCNAEWEIGYEYVDKIASE